MELALLTHENTAGDEISKTLKSGKYSDFKAAVAYVRNSGVGRIYNELAEFSNNGGKTTIIAGIDQNNTSYQALVNLKSFAKDSLFIHHDNNFDITFHPKVYIFGNNEIEKIIIGSSNLTAGGFFLNYEANIDVTLDASQNAKVFQKQVSDYWDGLLKDENTKKCSSALLDQLLEHGSVSDERKQKQFREIIQKISGLPFKSKTKKGKKLAPIAPQAITEIPVVKEKFAMTLSGFDVSKRSSDPVMLIPLAALRSMPQFWNWPMYYTDSGAGYPHLYAMANISLDGETIKGQHIRIYYYDRKKEFRLQCEIIKRNGTQGDIVAIHKNPNEPMHFDIQLYRQGTQDFDKIKPLLINKASMQKFYSYY